jgi:hypothetical protein
VATDRSYEPTSDAPAAGGADTAPGTTQAAGEFGRYRRFVSWFILTFVLLGSVYMLVSVAVTIYRRQHAVPLGSPVGEQATAADTNSCYDELTDVVEGLQKYLENSHALMARTDPSEVQRWADAGSYWRGQWKAVGERCRFERRHTTKTWEEMAVIHAELRETEASYTKEVTRFGSDLAPRLDRLRTRLARIDERLSLPQE